MCPFMQKKLEDLSQNHSRPNRLAFFVIRFNSYRTMLWTLLLQLHIFRNHPTLLRCQFHSHKFLNFVSSLVSSCKGHPKRNRRDARNVTIKWEKWCRQLVRATHLPVPEGVTVQIRDRNFEFWLDRSMTGQWLVKIFGWSKIVKGSLL